MSYSEQILSRANARLEKRRQQRQTAKEEERRRIYREIPEVAQIDRSIQKTIPKVLSAAFRKGEDPTEAVSKLKEENLEMQKRKSALLKEAGYQDSDLEDIPFCPLCEDSGWRGTKMCRCLAVLCAEEQIQELSSLLTMGEQTFDSFRLSYYGEELWPEYGRSPRQNMEKVLTFSKNYGECFGKSPVKNLFFYGGPGLGKTFLSACIARTVAQKGFSVVYDTAGNIFAQFEEQKFSRDALGVQEARDQTRKYLRCDLLIVDDLGSEMTTPFVQSALYQLVNTRLIEGRRTIISSNFSMDDLRRRYTLQIVSRLEGEYEPLPFFGKDIRLLKKA